MQVRGADDRLHHTTFATDGHTAVVEVANTCGLATLPPGRRAPTTSSSYGFGEAILAARHDGPDASCWRSAVARAPTAGPECWQH
jgi:glycerate 2-kinase